MYNKLCFCTYIKTEFIYYKLFGKKYAEINATKTLSW